MGETRVSKELTDKMRAKLAAGFAAGDQAELYETASERDEAVYEYICDNSYVTSGELGQHIGTNARTAANSAMRLFNAGRIAKADVYNRVGQQRSTMTLWATSAADFVEGEADE